MKSINNVDASGVPPIIHTNTNHLDDSRLDSLLDRLQLAIDSTAHQKVGPTSNMNDEPTADETSSESASDFSSCSGCYEATHGDNDSNEDDSSSTKSDHSNTSTRLLLKQAQLRLQHQSICEEVEVLRAEVAQYKQSIDEALRQKLNLKDRCNSLESQLDQTMKTIHNYKLKEQKWSDVMSEREKEFMNQLNELCSDMKAKEQYLLGEIVQRDKKLIEMQKVTTWAKNEGCGEVISVERQDIMEMDMDDDSWSDDSSCNFL
jgi:hypothetical protein